MEPLRFLHIGDLHLTQPGLENHRAFEAIIDQANTHLFPRIDFAVLPGDMADDGTPEQFALVAREMSRLRAPWHAIPGDHDFKPRTLDAYYSTLNTEKLPYARTIAGCRCLFLDVVSAGTGGPDFRIARAQREWLRSELEMTRHAGQKAVLFMHTYPDDLGGDAADIAALIDGSPVVLVDMGHTHYNELSHDGRTIYAATRSTGQIEEGDAGFALVAIDNGIVSWRFKPLDSPWPFVMVTAPADRRLELGGSQIGGASLAIHAAVWGETPIADVAFRSDDGDWQSMTQRGDGLYAGDAAGPAERRQISVRAIDARGGVDVDTIEYDPNGPVLRSSTGSDANRVAAWPERHLLGTQLGPNRNGRKW